MTKGWVGLLVVVSSLVGLVVGFAFAIRLNPQTADVYLLNLGSVGDWVSGVGALSAVFVTLWLNDKQRKENTERIKVEQVSREEGLLISVISSGNRPSLVTGLYIGHKNSEEKLHLSKSNFLKEKFPIGRIDFGELISVLVLDKFDLQIAQEAEKRFGKKFDDLLLIVTTSLGRFSFPLDSVYVSYMRHHLESELKRQKWKEANTMQ
ncbi:hypothetical protein ACW9HW_02010 [Pseudomonas sp. SDO5532_S415]|jgi:hypothetical protein|uniref:hypothetical protein n=1 Tax=Pseudomonas sp. Irchel 3A7 TaxID=2008913 RepID=UPI000BA3E8C3|nr:hypothetical protein [Pseudomonas sp. Irchel 3A7]